MKKEKNPVDRFEVEWVFTSIVGASLRRAKSPKNVRKHPFRGKRARNREIEAFELGIAHAMEAFYQAVGDKPRREPPQPLP